MKNLRHRHATYISHCPLCSELSTTKLIQKVAGYLDHSARVVALCCAWQPAFGALIRTARHKNRSLEAQNNKRTRAAPLTLHCECFVSLTATKTERQSIKPRCVKQQIHNVTRRPAGHSTKCENTKKRTKEDKMWIYYTGSFSLF